MDHWKSHQKNILHCERCPRLRKHCLQIAKLKRASFIDQTYYAKPVLGFGDTNPQLMIVGLAPAAHGANRTGRMFTGDRSGDWLYRALFKAKYANQPQSESVLDGLTLTNAWITAAARCAPPDNKPSPTELKNCSSYLSFEIERMDRVCVYIALGKIGFDQLLKSQKALGWITKSSTAPKFKHGLEVTLSHPQKTKTRTILCSYHPSQQNTFTKRLTEPMFDSVFKRANTLISHEVL